jgi:ubiquinone/menaquinone biosynthesis C-methylase UbiE
MKSQYTQDVEFNSGFGSLQTPIHLFTAAVLCGYNKVDVTEPFRYLDLACGNGHTLTLLADAYPHAEFIGIDINPAHIEKAKLIAKRAGLNNVTFIQGDVVDIGAEDYQPFDVCAASGVFSWLDEERQKKLLTFAHNVVRKGGLFYLDYSSQPGMSQNATLYKMIQLMSKQQKGNSAEKLRSSVLQLDKIRQGGGMFFKQNSGANDRFSTILDNPASDEAHEVLNLQQNGLWSHDVIQALAQHQFNYLGDIGLHHNVKAFSEHIALPDNIETLSIANQQMLKDVAWNVHQRKDLYIHCSDFTPTPILDSLADKCFYISPGALHEQQIALIRKQYPGATHILRSNIERLQKVQHESTFAKLISVYKSAEMSIENIQELFCQLLATRIISIAVSPPNDTEVNNKTTFSLPSQLNQLILEDDIHLEHARPFISPVIGSRLSLPLKDRLYIWAIVKGDVGAAWDRMGELTKLFQGPTGKGINKTEFRQIIEKSLPAFKQKIVPELVRLGILQKSI